MSFLTPHIGSQLIDMGSALLLLTCFAIVAQRRLSACVDLFALQSVFLALTAALVAFLTGIHHIYIAAALTIVIKVVVIPRILKQVIERLNVILGHGIDFVLLEKLLLVALGLYLVASLFLWLQGYLLNGAVQRSIYSLRSQVEDKVNRLPLSLGW